MAGLFALEVEMVEIAEFVEVAVAAVWVAGVDEIVEIGQRDLTLNENLVQIAA